ncbi:IND1 [Symbiodinium sp. KB8]|nr:IND1 [Symbiodinium sp. KB8]
MNSSWMTQDKRREMLEQYRVEMGEGFTKEAKRRLFDKWYPGQSHRYKHLFHSWLRSMEMEAEYKKDGNVFYHPELLIGSGSHAKVYLGIVPADGREVAIKVFRDRAGSEHFAKEVRAMKENTAIFGIMQYITSFEQRKVWYEEHRSTKRRREERVQVVILELMEGTLQEAMSTWGDLDAEQHLDVVCSASRSLLDILSRLNPVGDQGYVHRDIKPDNIMIDCRGNIRLSDFGIARALRGDEAQLFSPTCGSCPQFTPPEVLRYATLHKTSDLYSAGRVMIAMMLTDPSLSSLWDRRLELEQVPAQWPGYKRHAFLRLVEALTHRDKHCRAYSDKLQDVSQLYQVLLAHPFFWSDDRAMDFLTMLGNSYSQSSGQGFEEMDEKLNHAVHQALQIAQKSNSSWWYEEVRDLDREKRVTWEKESTAFAFADKETTSRNGGGLPQQVQSTIPEEQLLGFVRQLKDKPLGPRGQSMADAHSSAKLVLLCASGKGGVGKSTLSVNLAYMLRQMRFEVALLDLDIYGPSLPELVRLPPNCVTQNEAGRIIPIDYGGVALMSWGYVNPGVANTIRAPIANQIVTQLLTTVEWGQLDILIIDSPPGTGDVLLSIAQTLPVDGALLVTTSNSISLADVNKGLQLFSKVEIDPLLVVRNMASVCCEACHHSQPLFVDPALEGLTTYLAEQSVGLVDLPLDQKLSQAHGQRVKQGLGPSLGLRV